MTNQQIILEYDACQAYPQERTRMRCQQIVILHAIDAVTTHAGAHVRKATLRDKLSQPRNVVTRIESHSGQLQ